ncbi:hypothetical protein KIM372_17970 (plasmid) [Bombiscardovia nodaiensis]|uniref:Uncharacterized protein n=1 Tax=Bombiscardovia nodaiensis TaxID=2932181 RepID=A0ABM8BBA0_9BIFI|nr:hypothetical protein KIM372_17970 [Bombiscardovia nodaiensis]
MIDPWQFGQQTDRSGSEDMVVRQLSAVLYALLTGTIPGADKSAYPSLESLPLGLPEEFRIICMRGMGLKTSDGVSPIPLVTLAELTALLGPWTPPEELTDQDMTWLRANQDASITTVHIKPAGPQDLLDLPASLLSAGSRPAKTAAEPRWGTNQLLFPERSEIEMLNLNDADTDLFSLFDERKLQSSQPAPDRLKRTGRAAQPTQAVDVSVIRHPSAHSDPMQAVTGQLPFPLVGQAAGPAQPQATLSSTDSDASDAASRADDLFAQTDHGSDPGLASQTSFPPLAGSVQEDARTSAASTNWDFEAPTGITRPVGSDPSDLSAEIPANNLRRQTREQPGAGRPTVSELPPSFTPGRPNSHAPNAYSSLEDDADADESVSDSIDDDVADARLLGRFSTKSVVIALAACLVVIGLVWASVTLLGHRSVKSNQQDSWPQMSAAPLDGSTPETEESQAPVKHDAKAAGEVPKPHVSTNTTPYPVLTQLFFNRPAGQDGMGWYIHLDAPHEVSRLEISIQQHGGHGQVFANATAAHPTPDQPVAEFTFDASGNTQVSLQRPVTAQDFMVWVPTDGLPPEGGLHFNDVKVF